MLQRIHSELALVLHTYPYRNTSLIVELFTEHYGRVKVVARSARGTTSRYRGLLQPFVPLLVSWSGRTDLKSLGQVELHASPYLLCTTALWSGFYLNELLVKLLQRDDPYTRLFHYYQSALAEMVDAKQLEITLRRFEKRLLQELGYGLPLNDEINYHHPIEADQYYEYHVESGFALCSENIKKNVFKGDVIIALRQEDFSKLSHLRDCKRLLRLAIHALLSGKSLKSREVFLTH